MTVNISARKAERLPIGSKEREPYYRNAIAILETYAEKAPALSRTALYSRDSVLRA